MFDDRRRLEDRVFRLSTGFAWSQAPSSRTVRMVSQCRGFRRPQTPTQRMVRSNFLINEFWDDETRVLAGWAGHRVPQDRRRLENLGQAGQLLDCDQCIRNPSIIL